MFKKFIKIFESKQKRVSNILMSKVKLHSVLLFFPYSWSILFFLIPALLILKISFSKACMCLPPFSPLMENVGDYCYNFYIYIGNYITLFNDSFYFSSLLSSFMLAGSATIVCLIIGYSMAYSISRTQRHTRIILILMVVLPFVTSFLIRVYAWMSLLNTKGILNVLLLKIGIISSPIHFLDNNYAVCLVMVYCYLPFMIIPIYAALDKIDNSLVEASLDLGTSNWSSFWSVTVPLSMPGIIAGCTLVFVPALGEFVIPELIGGSKTITIGQTIWGEFFNNRDWPLASAIAVLMMFSFIFCTIFSKIKGIFNKKK